MIAILLQVLLATPYPDGTCPIDMPKNAAGLCEPIHMPPDNMSVIGDQNIGVTAAPPPKCKTGWSLLTYPGTSTVVCAKEIEQPLSDR